MSTGAPSAAQIREYVASLRAKHPNDRVFGIRTDGSWSGPARLEIGSEPVEVAQCDSVLAIRERLSERSGESPMLVLLTRVPQAELGGDVLGRLARRRLHEFDSWDLVMERFRAREVDPRLVREGWIAGVLAGLEGGNGFPITASGYLDSETVWGVLLSRLLDLRVNRPDALDLLRWATDGDHLRRYQATPGEFRAGLRRWVVEVAGPVAQAILDCIESCDGPGPLAVGLVCGVVYAEEAEGSPDLNLAAGRLERFHGNRRLPPGAARQWAAAAREAVEDLASNGHRMVADRVVETADDLLREIGAEAFAWLSDLSQRGFLQRLERYAKALTATLERPEKDDEFLATARLALAHAKAGADMSTRIEMSLRTAKWVAEAPADPGATLSEAAARYVASSSFVDWARSMLRGGEESAELSAAYEGLLEKARDKREEENRWFGEQLAAWSASSSRLMGAIPIEEVLTQVVGPLAESNPVLVVVVDGMSVAIFREFLDDLLKRNWVLLAPAKGKLQGLAPLAGIAAIPTITEVSRSSLLSGELTRGGSSVEKQNFKKHPALLSVSKPKRLPLLLHKGDLLQAGGTELSSAARDAVAAKEQHVVGVVLNAVDDHLDNADQVRPRWTLDYFFQPLAALLETARLAGRIVILTSDHGHVLDADTTRQKSDFGDRWRVSDGEAGEGEVVLTGQRVGTAAGNRVIAPWSERIRYGGKKNGYHGGASPQEVIVPIGVIAPPNVRAPGWVEAGPSYPSWWEVSFEERAAALPAVEPARVRRPKVSQGQLFPKSEAEPPGPAKVAWIEALFGSETYQAQKKLVGRSAPRDADVERFLIALDERGGKLTRNALATRLDYAPVRLGGVVAVVRRLLNVEGYAVLSLDPASDTVELNAGLLRKQFEIDSDD